MGFLNNLFSGHWENSFGGGVGSFMNNITGQKQSARKQYEYNQKLQTNAQEFSKWQMQNAHQTEIQDLQNAGLNPVLSANQGASASVGGGSTGAGSASGNPIEMLGAVVNMMNTSKQTNGTISNLEAQSELARAEATKALKEAGFKQKEIDYYMKHGVFPGATTQVSTSTPWGSSGEIIPVGLNNNTNSSRATAQRDKRDKSNKKQQERLDKLHKEHNWWY